MAGNRPRHTDATLGRSPKISTPGQRRTMAHARRNIRTHRIRPKKIQIRPARPKQPILLNHRSRTRRNNPKRMGRTGPKIHNNKRHRPDRRAYQRHAQRNRRTRTMDKTQRTAPDRRHPMRRTDRTKRLLRRKFQTKMDYTGTNNQRHNQRRNPNARKPHHKRPTDGIHTNRSRTTPSQNLQQNPRTQDTNRKALGKTTMAQPTGRTRHTG